MVKTKDGYTKVLACVTKEGRRYTTCDFVRCNNCGRRMIVDLGTDACPSCGEEALVNEVFGHGEISVDYATAELKEMGYTLCHKPEEWIGGQENE